MKRAALPPATAGLACAVLLACHAGVGGHLSEPDKDAIRKVVEEATRTVLPPVSDVDAYVKLYYAEDARVLPPNHATVTGREAIAALFRSSGAIEDYTLTILAVEGRNDLAYAHSAYQITVTPPGAAEPFGDQGKGVEVWKKQGDGSWKVILD
ncbi:MAG TPA: nuclear transport factor 2 family protein, partial [Vicinamibacteria bacterium]|nr:nuclear transport factor 2 family protein [Vicinamibacteria bacterium]